ncbi:MAG: GntR family transcriptional regulator, partial [Methylococcales bacterium]|nr:GntR family transcriptional regulator [Methylococcales bacterium]
MIAIGKFNQLKIIKQHAKEFCLDGGDSGDVILQATDASKDSKVGDELNVFVYVDAKDELHATTRMPLAQVDDVAWLKVVSVS